MNVGTTDLGMPSTKRTLEDTGSPLHARLVAKPTLIESLPDEQRPTLDERLSALGGAEPGVSLAGIVSRQAAEGVGDKTAVAHVRACEEAVAAHVDSISETLSRGPHAIAIVDDFVSDDFVTEMRREAVALKRAGGFAPSETLARDPTSGAVQSFTKRGVFATELVGGTQCKDAARLMEYVICLTHALPPALNRRWQPSSQEAPPVPFSTSILEGVQCNKLACVEGRGAGYARHVDAGDGERDSRKLTAILYLNPRWQAAQGGVLRAHPGGGSAVVDIEPRGGRLVLFWSRHLAHEVLPYFGTSSDESASASIANVSASITNVAAVASDDVAVPITDYEQDIDDHDSDGRFAITVWLCGR